VILEKADYHIIPGLIQGLIHGKITVGNARGTDDFPGLVFQVQIHAGNVFRSKRTV